MLGYLLQEREDVSEVRQENSEQTGKLLWLSVSLLTRSIPLTTFARRLGFPARHCTAMSERRRRHQIGPNNYTEISRRILGFTQYMCFNASNEIPPSHELRNEITGSMNMLY